MMAPSQRDGFLHPFSLEILLTKDPPDTPSNDTARSSTTSNKSLNGGAPSTTPTTTTSAPKALKPSKASKPSSAPPPPKKDRPKPHVCTICHRCFARLEHVKRHERSHTAERPHACPDCGRRFARRDILLRHQKKLHRFTGKDGRPYTDPNPAFAPTAAPSRFPMAPSGPSPPGNFSAPRHGQAEATNYSFTRSPDLAHAPEEVVPVSPGLSTSSMECTYGILYPHRIG